MCGVISSVHMSTKPFLQAMIRSGDGAFRPSDHTGWLTLPFTVDAGFEGMNDFANFALVGISTGSTMGLSLPDLMDVCCAQELIDGLLDILFLAHPT